MTAITNNQIVIVTGLPRSGTSMMMKMLEAGGVPPLCDGERTADSDNPNGYYEFEPVKRTKDDAAWLSHAAGKAVKMVYSLLYDLPADVTEIAEDLGSTYCDESPDDFRYDVIFMRRDLNEILASQQRMLANMKIESAVDDNRMAKLFTNEIARFQEWIEASAHINFTEVSYNDVASGTVAPIHQINSHLGNGLDVTAMSAVVDPTLYRNRVA